MKGFTLCFVYLLIAVCNVHSASYYYRAGREVIVPVAEELVVAESARKEEPLIALETLEVVPVELVDPAKKVATVADTVKSAAIEAVRTQNEEVVAVIDDIKPVATVVENVEPAIPSSVPVVKTDVVVVPIVESNEPNIKAVQEVIEEVKAAPVSPSEHSNVRQNPLETIGAQIQNAVQNIQHQITSFPLISNFVNRPQNQQAAQAQDVVAAVEQADSLTPSSSSSSSSSPASSDKPQIANSISPAAAGPTQATAVSVTPAPQNLLQNALQSITNFLQPRTTTVAPVAPITESSPVVIISGTKDGDDNVIVEHYVNVDHKIDGIVKEKH